MSAAWSSKIENLLLLLLLLMLLVLRDVGRSSWPCLCKFRRAAYIVTVAERRLFGLALALADAAKHGTATSNYCV